MYRFISASPIVGATVPSFLLPAPQGLAHSRTGGAAVVKVREMDSRW